MSNTGMTLSASGPPNGIHIEIVTGSCDALAPVATGSGAPWSSVPAVHAAANRPNTASTIASLFIAPSLSPSFFSRVRWISLPNASRRLRPREQEVLRGLQRHPHRAEHDRLLSERRDLEPDRERRHRSERLRHRLEQH